jgi:hypothetical protein
MNFPYTREGDYCFSLINFIALHQRMPRTQRGHLADALFHILTTDEILDPLRVFVSDKEYLKDFVKARIGDQYNVPTLGVIDSVEDVDGFDFPENCVIKPTHMSGQVIYRKIGSELDKEHIKKWLLSNFYPVLREANYKYLRPRVIVEPFIFDSDNNTDYKIFCLHGRPLLIYVINDRKGNRTDNIYTSDWGYLPYSLKGKPGPVRPRPESLDLMLEIATNLSADFNFVRIDLYSDGRKVLVGEITNCTQASRCKINPPDGEEIIAGILFGDGGFTPDVLKKGWRSDPASHSSNKVTIS